jgi:hypothetical protein
MGRKSKFLIKNAGRLLVLLFWGNNLKDLMFGKCFIVRKFLRKFILKKLKLKNKIKIKSMKYKLQVRKVGED